MLNFYDIKAEKANSILRHNKLGRKMTSLFRLVETLIVLFLVVRLSFAALKHSGLIFREFLVILFSPRFVFVVGNLIVVVLFAGSGRATSATKRSGAKTASVHVVEELYDEFLRRNEKNQKTLPVRRSENKETSSEKEAAAKRSENNEACLEIKSFERSKSEVFSERAKKVRVLKRSETEKIGRKMAVVNYKGDENINKVTKCLDYYYPEDTMSGEEFRLKVEAFIARQQRFRMEEDFSGDEQY